MKFEVFTRINKISKKEWNELTGVSFPFLDYEFLEALEVSGCVGEKTGQIPIYLCLFEDKTLAGACVLYLKNHSYGEYIFDWGWADAYARYGVNYYPKLMLYNPFTPAVGPKLLAKNFIIKKKLSRFVLEFANGQNVSSFHALFIDQEEKDLFKEEAIKERFSLQYHFHNKEYKNFEDFLESLKMRKRKAILKERNKIRENHIQIKMIEGDELEKFSSLFYNFYLKTIDKKSGMAYLNSSFFKTIFKTMSGQIKLFVAFQEENIIGMSLCFYKGKKLYGRYWGGYEGFPNLHFELCYYSPIEYCIRQKIEVFEAGAQGEHKIARGFDPVMIKSFHKIYDPDFQVAIEEFIDAEKIQIMGILDELMLESSYKSII